VVDKKGTRAAAEAYLKFLYTPDGQMIAARNYYRPRDPEIAARYESVYPRLQLFTIDEVFSGWHKAQTTHFSEGGVFDKIYSQ
jgi:sulfate transport system substrate-binding protein